MTYQITARFPLDRVETVTADTAVQAYTAGMHFQEDPLASDITIKVGTERYGVTEFYRAISTGSVV